MLGSIKNKAMQVGVEGEGILPSLDLPSHPSVDVLEAWRKWRLVYNPDPVLKVGGTSCSIAQFSPGLCLLPSHAQVGVLKGQGMVRAANSLFISCRKKPMPRETRRSRAKITQLLS